MNMSTHNTLPSIENTFLTKDGFGLTMTSANHLANLGKEIVKEKKTALENISFLSSKIATPTCPQGMDYQKPCFNLDTIVEDIKTIGEVNTFIALMREGIRAKKEVLESIDKFSFNEWLKAKDIELVAPAMDEPADPTFLNTFSLGERYRMLRAEAIAAAFGKMIHPESPISEARSELLFRLSNPVEKEGSSDSFCLITYTPAVDTDTVDATFLKLQNEQRSAEKELNSFKFETEEREHNFAVEAKKKYALDYEAYTQKRNKLIQDYQLEMENLRHEASLLKIVVPEALMKTYNYLNGVGK